MKTARLSGPRRAFTLVEIMIVVAIMGVIMAMGLPPLLQSMRPKSVRKAALDLRDICNTARARAILDGSPATVVFNVQNKTFAVGGANGPGTSAQIPDDVKIEMLDVNLREYKEEETATVRFFPNGTSDEMTVVFVADDNERRAVSLEMTTALADIETDVRRLINK